MQEYVYSICTYVCMCIQCLYSFLTVTLKESLHIATQSKDWNGVWYVVRALTTEEF